MNSLDDQLGRLLRAAGSAPAAVFTSDPPFGLEMRVLAAWRQAPPAGFWNLGVLVRGLILSAAVMAVCLWPALERKASPDTDYLRLADSSLQVDNL